MFANVIFSVFESISTTPFGIRFIEFLKASFIYRMVRV